MNLISTEHALCIYRDFVLRSEWSLINIPGTWGLGLISFSGLIRTVVLTLYSLLILYRLNVAMCNERYAKWYLESPSKMVHVLLESSSYCRYVKCVKVRTLVHKMQVRLGESLWSILVKQTLYFLTNYLVSMYLKN